MIKFSKEIIEPSTFWVNSARIVTSLWQYANVIFSTLLTWKIPFGHISITDVNAPMLKMALLCDND